MGSIPGAYYCVMKLLIIFYFSSNISRISNAGSKMEGVRCTRGIYAIAFRKLKFLDYPISRLEWTGADFVPVLWCSLVLCQCHAAQDSNHRRRVSEVDGLQYE